MLDRLRHDIEEYYSAYHSELRKQIAEHDPEFQVLPHWLKGGRKVVTICCEDGVVVVHLPYEPDTMTFLDREDSYDFYLRPGELVGEWVAEYGHPWMNPGGLPVDMQPLIAEYAPGEDFGPGYWLEPRRSYSPLDSERFMTEEDKWSRLDYTNMQKLDIWQDVPRAREQARYIPRRYISDI
jgi:hypothetical protein